MKSTCKFTGKCSNCGAEHVEERSIKQYQWYYKRCECDTIVHMKSKKQNEI